MTATGYDGVVRVVYVADRVDLRGGAGRHLLQVIGWAVRSRLRVTVATGRIGGRVLDPANATLVRIPGLASRLATDAGLGELARQVGQADVIHVQNVMNPRAIALAAQTGRAVVTVQDHRFFCPGPGKTLPDGQCCRSPMADGVCAHCLGDEAYRSQLLDVTRARLHALADATVVVLSRYMAAELAAAGIPGALVIPPSFDVSGGEPEEGSAFLLAGRLVRHKAPVDAWAAWTRAGRPLPLRVAGQGGERRALEGAVHLGWLEPAALELELARSRALLLPSRWQEPFGMIGVEALARATPVIVGRSGGTDDWTDAGCIVVERGDVGAMAGALSELAHDPGRAVRLGRSGREMVVERFARAAIEGRLRLLYEAAAARA